MKFDLERAKSGDPVEYMETYGWVSVRFIGEWDADAVVCAVSWSYKPEVVMKDRLRMAEKKETVRYRIAAFQGFGGTYLEILMGWNDKSESIISDRGDFLYWLTDWIEA